MQSPNEDAVRILALAGSFRTGSPNHALIQTARELAPYQARIADSSGRLISACDPGKASSSIAEAMLRELDRALGAG